MILPLYASIENWILAFRAAYDLGATPFQAFRRVTLPLTMPGVISGSVMVFIPSLALFFVTDLLGGARSVFSETYSAAVYPGPGLAFRCSGFVALTVISLILIFVYVCFFSPKDDEGWI